MTKRLPPVEEQRRRAERKKIFRAASQTIADQAAAHRTEIATLAANYVAMKEALGEAVKLLDWIRGGGAGAWTHADSVKLAEWRERAEVKHGLPDKPRSRSRPGERIQKRPARDRGRA